MLRWSISRDRTTWYGYVPQVANTLDVVDMNKFCATVWGKGAHRERRHVCLCVSNGQQARIPWTIGRNCVPACRRAVRKTASCARRPQTAATRAACRTARESGPCTGRAGPRPCRCATARLDPPREPTLPPAPSDTARQSTALSRHAPAYQRGPCRRLGASHPGCTSGS